MARPDKAAAVAELTDAFREASATVLTEYRGLTVAQLKELRRSLAGNATYASNSPPSNDLILIIWIAPLREALYAK